MTGSGVPENIPPPDFFQAMVETAGAAHFVIRAGRVIYTNPAFDTKLQSNDN